MALLNLFRKVLEVAHSPLPNDAAITSLVNQLLLTSLMPNNNFSDTEISDVLSGCSFIGSNSLLHSDKPSFSTLLPNLSKECPRRVCQYEFRKNDIVWSCRNCQRDNTCVQCNACFENSNHKGHEVYFYHSHYGGCCDCGDSGAWSEKGFCSKHGDLHNNPIDLLPEYFKKSAPLVVSAVIEFVELFTHKYAAAKSVDCLKIVRSMPFSIPQSPLEAIITPPEPTMDSIRRRLGSGSSTSLSEGEGEGSVVVVEEAESQLIDVYRRLRMEMGDHDDGRYHSLMSSVSGALEVMRGQVPPHVTLLASLMSSVSIPSMQINFSLNSIITACIDEVQDDDLVCLVLLIDDCNRPEVVLTLLSRFAFLSETELSVVGQQIGAIGACVVRRAPLIQIRPMASDLVANGLTVRLVRDVVLRMEEVAISCCKWLYQMAQASDGSCRLVCEAMSQSRLFRIMCEHCKLSKKFVTMLNGLLLTLVADQPFKMVFAKAYADAFPHLSRDYCAGDGLKDSNICHLSVQFLNRLSYAKELSDNHGFLENLSAALHDAVQSASDTIGLRLSHSLLLNRRYSFIIGDMRIVFACEVLAKQWCVQCLPLWNETLMFCQEMHLQKRFFATHIEHESDDWLTSFNLSISLCNAFEPALSWFSDSKMISESSTDDAYSVLTTVYDSLTSWEKSRQAKLHLECTMEPSFPFNTLILVPKLSLDYSMHIPLSRFFSFAVFKMCKYSHLDRSLHNFINQYANRQQVLDHLSGFIGLPLQCIIFASQVKVGMWRRNGYVMLDQHVNYANAPFCKIFRDLDLACVQIFGSLLGCHEIINIVLRMLGVYHYLNGAPAIVLKGSDDSFLGGLLEEALTLLIQLAANLPQPSSDNVIKPAMNIARLEIIHKLVSGPKTFNQLHETVNSIEEFESDHDKVLEDIIKEVGDVREGNEMDASKVNLKPQFWIEYDPTHFHVSQQDHQQAEGNRPKPVNTIPIVSRSLLCHEIFSSFRRGMLLELAVVRIIQICLVKAVASKVPSIPVKHEPSVPAESTSVSSEGISSIFSPPPVPEIMEPSMSSVSTCVIHRVLQVITLAIYEIQDIRDSNDPVAQHLSNEYLHAFSQVIESRRTGLKSSIILLLISLHDMYTGGTSKEDSCLVHWSRWIIDQLALLDEVCSVAVNSRFQSLDVSKKIDSKQALKEKAKNKAMAAMQKSMAAFAAQMKVDDEEPALEATGDSTTATQDSSKTSDDLECIICREKKDGAGSELGLISFTMLSVSQRSMGEFSKAEGKKRRKSVQTSSGDDEHRYSNEFLGPVEADSDIQDFDDLGRKEPNDEDISSWTTFDGLLSENQCDRSVHCHIPTDAELVGECSIEEKLQAMFWNDCAYLKCSKNSKASLGMNDSGLMGNSCLRAKYSHECSRLHSPPLLHVQTCGHMVHHSCLDGYLASVAHQSEIQSHMLFNSDAGEFPCPLCRRLSNMLVPVHVNSEGNDFTTVDSDANSSFDQYSLISDLLPRQETIQLGLEVSDTDLPTDIVSSNQRMRQAVNNILASVFSLPADVISRRLESQLHLGPLPFRNPLNIEQSAIIERFMTSSVRPISKLDSFGNYRQVLVCSLLLNSAVACTISSDDISSSTFLDSLLKTQPLSRSNVHKKALIKSFLKSIGQALTVCNLDEIIRYRICIALSGRCNHHYLLHEPDHDNEMDTDILEMNRWMKKTRLVGPDFSMIQVINGCLVIVGEEGDKIQSSRMLPTNTSLLPLLMRNHLEMAVCVISLRYIGFNCEPDKGSQSLDVMKTLRCLCYANMTQLIISFVLLEASPQVLAPSQSLRRKLLEVEELSSDSELIFDSIRCISMIFTETLNEPDLNNDLLSITSICRIYAKYVSFLRSMVLLGLYNDFLSDSIIEDYSSMEFTCSSASIVQSLHEQEVWLSRVLGIISVTEWKSDETILYLIRLWIADSYFNLSTPLPLMSDLIGSPKLKHSSPTKRRTEESVSTASASNDHPWSSISRYISSVILNIGVFGTPVAYKPSLIHLPQSYTTFHSSLVRPDSSYVAESDSISSPAQCLRCGAILDAAGKADCTAHVQFCGHGEGAVFLLNDCMILMFHGSRAAYYPSPYVDAHGETNRSNARGKPLFLDNSHYEGLQKLWLEHGFPQEILSKRSSATRVVILDYY